MAEKVQKSEQEWRAELTPEQYRVLREHGTERAFTGAYHDSKEPGVYRCAACGAELFRSETKYDSGTGWPSFYEPASGDAVETERDWALVLPRTEVHCTSCGGHLGHVFGDGPAPTGLRYCINSAALDLERKEGEHGMTEKATFGAGCFWGVEVDFRNVPGVTDAAVGYMGGDVPNPTYEQVCTDRTGHAEVVQVEFDPDEVPYERLLDTFWAAHDPTQLDRQGPDVGRQYRSAIFFHSPEQQEQALASKARAQTLHERPVVTEVEPAADFWRAEDYHQQYLVKRGRASCLI